MLLTEVSGARTAAPDAFNLLASAERPQGEGWQAGISWRSELCPDFQLVPYCGDATAAPGEGDDTIGYAMPTVFRVADTCTTLSGRLDENRVVRRAEAVTSYAVASELWSGVATRADRFTVAGTERENPFLMDGNAAVVVGTGTVVERLAVLEEQARQALRGQRVFIHAPIRVVSAIGDKYTVVGNELRTPAGSVLIGDAGYSGDGPLSAGTSEVQEVALMGGPTGGTFTLTFAGQTTAPIAFDASTAAVRDALLALSNIDVGDIVVGGVPGTWEVTFRPELGDVAQMTGDGATLTGGVAPAVEVTTTTPGVAPAATAGTWAYATGPVQVRLDPVVRETSLSSTVDRGSNRRRLWAARLFLATFDPCGQFAMQITEPG